MRCRTHVSAFALVVYWHNPNGTPIVAARFPGSTAWRCRGRFYRVVLLTLWVLAPRPVKTLLFWRR